MLFASFLSKSSWPAGGGEEERKRIKESSEKTTSKIIHSHTTTQSHTTIQSRVPSRGSNPKHLDTAAVGNFSFTYDEN